MRCLKQSGGEVRAAGADANEYEDEIEDEIE